MPSGGLPPHGTVWATLAARPPNPSHVAAVLHFTAAPSRKHVLPQGLARAHCRSGCARRLPGHVQAVPWSLRW